MTLGPFMITDGLGRRRNDRYAVPSDQCRLHGEGRLRAHSRHCGPFVVALASDQQEPLNG
jgi:hypothetical protein